MACVTVVMMAAFERGRCQTIISSNIGLIWDSFDIINPLDA
jgi:hypothetical protein